MPTDPDSLSSLSCNSRFDRSVCAKRKGTPENHGQARYHDRMAEHPRRRPHRLIKNCRDTPAVGMARRTFRTGAEPNFSDERAVPLSLEIPDADAVARRVAGHKRADRA